ncbi:hypothetical protein PMI13_00547 [Chryseobacterium populi]|uniref:Helix-hairpin-helix motif-containing protein n=2 Tax=Chryseobacterium populi TaxID=1144316 RepID=J2KQE9_9FLAO|nr:hypothetical protein PMI13_00547 [Chryseobacterium populi]
MKKSYYQKVAFLGMLLIVLLGFQKLTSKEKEDFSDVKFISEASVPVHLSEFDPNDLSEKQWQQLGFSDKQTSTILNYKKIIGGKFTSKEQFKKCYAVSEEKFIELNAFILLPETNKEARSGQFENFGNRTITVSGKFNPDHFSVNDWINTGFSEKQAEAIIKYKGYLGGNFISKEKFKECFIISDEKYKKLAPYLILPEKTPENFKSISHYKSKIQYQPFDPNILDIEGWQALGFSQNQAKVIVNYRDRNLKGSFRSLSDLEKCFVISAEKFQELKPYINIDLKNTKNSTNLSSGIQQEKTDFSTVDLNSITFKQLIEFGLDERSAGSMLGFRKKLGGFVNKQQILDTYNINKDLVQKLISICKLNTSDIQKYTLVSAPEEWLKNHPYFKYSADKIIYYRVTYPNDKKIWNLLKVKPEYEARMKLYLKE